MNPFEQRPLKTCEQFEPWPRIYPCAYDKNETDPYTKTRIILMNGTEFEAVKFGHQFARHCPNQELRRRVSLSRRMEQQQQKILAVLKPIDETILEHTISYEQLAVDLTARMAQRESDPYVKATLDFALLEDFDHLYRYANLLDMEYGTHAERLVGRYTEIMPGRPTISEHRHPHDNVRRYMNSKNADLLTRLHANIITAAEQQTMNYYMNIAGFYTSDRGRQLYQEIAMIEEQHVTQYESLIDPRASWLEMLVEHEYTECYLYYSMMCDETNQHVRSIFEWFFNQELGHLHDAVKLLEQYEGKSWQEVIPCGEFPELLTLGENIDYVRCVQANTVHNTSVLEDYVPVDELSCDAPFFCVQRTINGDGVCTPSHTVICDYIAAKDRDYRFQVADHPTPELADRTQDNTTVGRKSQRK